eukprot:CAMPEP_0170519234 /NCGR_PEP_ID=MMETSP0209-20121228/4728_1 /TAXON_ID=665100 ORGANISM="Litonotus pictus, Strain P1" /NCGR_SAMPLE_ID=MMETSP0209 /ASSEMBLY_ACC=CAM_ASM_000301 /LENGTH=356 /DNA_ID=CAMNT_0010805073 /DNA_START=566 /DNA_END=1633 /DNA_ORIENTATION=-
MTNLFAIIEIMKVLSQYSLHFLINKSKGKVTEENFSKLSMKEVDRILEESQVMEYLEKMLSKNRLFEILYLSKTFDLSQVKDNLVKLFPSSYTKVLDLFKIIDSEYQEKKKNSGKKGNTTVKEYNPKVNPAEEQFRLKTNKYNYFYLNEKKLTPSQEYDFHFLDYKNSIYKNDFLDFCGYRTSDISLLSTKISNKGIFMGRSQELIIEIKPNICRSDKSPIVSSNASNGGGYYSISSNNNLPKYSNKSSLSDKTVTLKKLRIRPFINDKEIYDYTKCTGISVYSLSENSFDKEKDLKKAKNWTYIGGLCFDWQRKDPKIDRLSDFDPEVLEYELNIETKTKISMLKIVSDPPVESF